MSQLCYKIVCSAPFNITITILILLNTYFLASYRYDESRAYSEFKENIDHFFVAVFTIELILKVIGFGPKAFFKEKINIFDAAVVLVSLAEFVLSSFVG